MTGPNPNHHLKTVACDVWIVDGPSSRFCDMLPPMRVTCCGCRERLPEGVRTMIEWSPERAVPSHGRWYERNRAAGPRRAFGCFMA